jgi:DNA polymerase IV
VKIEESELHPSWLKRKVIHVDMDCFYAAVEQRDQPELKGKPVIVGGRHRGVVCAASYEARKFGVHSAMPISRAKSLCRGGTFLPVRMARYQECSKDIHAIFRRYTDLIQPISLDEAFLDVSQPKVDLPWASTIARRIKEEIRDELGLIASAGVGPNKLVSKIASDMDKPDGMTVVPPEEVSRFLNPLPVKRIWGIGKKAEEKLKNLGISTIADLAQTSEEILLRHFGQHGSSLHLLSLGIDQSEVKLRSGSKSIGRERTYPEPVLDPGDLKEDLENLSEELGKRLKKKGLKARSLTLKFKRVDFELFTRSTTEGQGVDDQKELLSMAKKIMSEKVDTSLFPIRLFGMSCSHLEQEDIPSLFELLDEESGLSET